jgi:hypothetical protein
MGKNRDIKSLIRLMSNTIVHEIVAKHTNRPESEKSLNFEVIEYRGQTKKMYGRHNWNQRDKENIKNKVLRMVREKLSIKYSDVSYSEDELEDLLEVEMEVDAL